MSLKTIINDPVEVPGPLRDHYRKAGDGRFALVLDGEPTGYVKAEKLTEFRANNRALNQANAELAAKLKAFDGIDLAEYEAMKAKLAEVPADLAEQHAAEIAALTEQHASALAALQDQKLARASTLEAELAAEKEAHAATQFRNTITTEFLRAGGRESAVEFMVANAGKTFAMKDGKTTTNEFSATNPGAPLTVEEWIDQQRTVSDFVFKPSKGGGARPNQSGPPAKRSISSDPIEFGKHLAAIASGDVTVF